MVSVIIPNYNHEEFLKRRIESVLSQTFQDFQVILLDDCSTDNSKTIMESYRHHPKISSIQYNDVNSGSPFKQWQKGIQLAKGELIWIAESDDWCEPSLLGELVLPFTKDPEITLAHCQVMLVKDNRITPIARFKELSSVDPGNKFICEHLFFINDVPNASAVIFKKEAFLKTAEKYKEMAYCGDWLIWISIARQGKVYTSGKFLNYFFKHKNDVTSRAMDNGVLFYEGLYITKKVIKELAPPPALIRKAKQFWIKAFNNKKDEFEKSVRMDIAALLKETFSDNKIDLKNSKSAYRFFFHRN